MGLKSSKNKDGTKPPKTKKRKKRSGQNVEVSPNPDAYSQLEDMQSVSGYQSSEDLRFQPNPHVSPRNKPPPVPGQHAENRVNTQFQPQNFEDHTGKADSDNVYHSSEMESKPKVTADRNYESNQDNDISFRKGDILQLITEGCFFNDLNRQEAEEKLLEPGIEVGTYLLRPSEDGYALSLRCENELYELEIRHYKIRVTDRGICFFDADSRNTPFSNIVELIKYYTEKRGFHCKLTKPLPQNTSLHNLAVKISDLKLREKLGSGNFGSVYAGTLHNNTQVAVKSLKAGGSMTIEDFREEAETMHKLRHPNLVSLLAICEGHGRIYIITERMSKGALLTLLREDTDHTIKFMDLIDMAIQVAEGMCYLEKKAFVHRDLRAANVLVGDGNITKIADFGLARLLDSYYYHEDFYQDKKGALLPYKWTAPEAIKQLKFTVKSDVWSFGILLYEIVTRGDEPYSAMTNAEALGWLEKGNRLKRPKEHHCPLALYNIMKQCWLTNSNERPNFADIKETLIEIKTYMYA